MKEKTPLLKQGCFNCGKLLVENLLKVRKVFDFLMYVLLFFLKLQQKRTKLLSLS